MSCTVLLSCSVCAVRRLSACLLSFLHVEILTEKSHNALCSTQPTAKGLIIIGASQGKADTSIHPDSKPCSDDLIRYLLFASRLLSHYMRINLFVHQLGCQRMSLLLPSSLEDIGRMAGTLDEDIPPFSRPTSSHQVKCHIYCTFRTTVFISGFVPNIPGVLFRNTTNRLSLSQVGIVTQAHGILE